MTLTKPTEGETPMPQAFTFGLKYVHENHPYLHRVDTNGWAEIHGCNPAIAREVAVRLFGRAFAFQYDVTHVRMSKHFPNGPFLIIRVTESGQLIEMTFIKNHKEQNDEQ